MFGKAEWFQKNRSRWLKPVSWQGWAYGAVWSAVVALPILLFQFLGKTPESLIWAVASLGGCAWDVGLIRRAIIASLGPEDLFVIDEDTDISHLTTRNYDMNLRD